MAAGLKNHPVEYDDKIARQLIECMEVISADMIKIYFKDGTVKEVLIWKIKYEWNSLKTEAFSNDQHRHYYHTEKTIVGLSWIKIMWFVSLM